MKIKNQRRFPTDMSLGDKEFSDLVYCLMQVNSNRNKDEEHRYIYKKDINKTEWGKTIGMSPKTILKKINKLVKDEYAIDNGSYYTLPNKGYSFIMPVETMRKLINTTTKNEIKVYSYLGRLRERYGDKAYFTKTKLIEMLGLSPKKDSNWLCIKDILEDLEMKGLLKYETQYIKGEGNMVHKHMITKMSKEIKWNKPF